MNELLNTCPGPHRQELLNDLQEMQKNPLRLFSKLIREYGDFVHINLGIMQVYLINHPDSIQQVLQLNNRNYNKDTFQYNLLRSITGKGLLTNDGEEWLRQRRLIQPAFHKNRITSFGNLMTESTLQMLRRWDVYVENDQPVDIDAEMMQLTLGIVGKTLFSVDLSDQASELTESTLTVLDYIVHRARHPFSIPTRIPTSRNRQFNAALNKLDASVFDIIKLRRNSIEKYFSNAMVNNTDIDLISLLLQAREEDTGAQMTDLQLRDEMITLLIAGHETVASALIWTWYLLSLYPEIELRLHKELDEILAGRVPTSADLSNLPYTRMVFEEALRLYPPAWLITRKALSDDDFNFEGCYRISAKSLVVISPYLVHRHSEVWHEPEIFDPSRFSPEESARRHRFAYIPFGGGPRLCIGDGFAMLEAQLIIATIGQKYRLRRLDQQLIEPEPLVTLRPKGGLMMKLQPRN